MVEDVITTGGSVLEVINQIKKYNGNVIGIGVLVDRSNGSAKLHDNQFSIIALDATSYSSDNIPDSLASVPIQKPGSRNTK